MPKNRKSTQPSSAYKPLGGSSRQYADQSGNRISRRAFEDIKARESGFTSWREYQQLRNDPTYQRMARYAISEGGKDWKQLRSMDSEFNQLFMKARKPLDRKSGKGYTNPNGPVGKLLKYVGLRSEFDTYDVGDTP